MSLSGRVCVVTGASRGLGKGIALQLGEAGATVYITARTLKAKEGVQGSLEETAKQIENRGGKCIPVQCDHTKDEEVLQLFERVKAEQDGRLDLLVNNAYAAVNVILDSWGKKFWELPTSVWDDVNNVGLRNHYVCTVHATKMMLERGEGLIVWVSSVGGLKYLFNIAYGVGKAACDRMAADCGFELRKKNIACISLWPGLVRTEKMQGFAEQGKGKLTDKIATNFITGMGEGIGETPEFSGKAIVGLLQDKNVMKKSGKIIMTGDLGDEYGFIDVDGKRAHSVRSIAGLAELSGHTTLAWWIPRWIKVPKWVFALVGSKF